MKFNEIMDYVYRNPSQIMPEFDFIDKGSRWLSNNKQKISGRVGKTKSQVMIYKNKPYLLVDHSEDSVHIFTYLQESRNLSKAEAVQLIKEVYNIIETTHISSKINTNKTINITPSEPTYLHLPFYLIREKIHFVESDNISKNHTFNEKDIRNYTTDKPSNFIKYLQSKFSNEVVNEIINRFYIGQSDWAGGSTIFWNIDENYQLCRGKIMKYTPLGKREKQTNGNAIINSVQNLLKKAGKLDKESIQKNCYFGLHQIRDFPFKTIAIVESEKTACLCSQYFPDLIWLATGSVAMLKERYYKVLKDKEIILYPDKGEAYNLWEKEAEKMRLNGYTVSVSKFLESCDFAKDKEDILDVIN